MGKWVEEGYTHGCQVKEGRKGVRGTTRYTRLIVILEPEATLSSACPQSLSAAFVQSTNLSRKKGP